MNRIRRPIKRINALGCYPFTFWWFSATFIPLVKNHAKFLLNQDSMVLALIITQFML